LNCPYCGQVLPDPSPVSCPNCGRNLQVALANYYPEAQFQGRKGLGDLKNGFLVYLIAAVLGLVPVISSIAGILILVALILLIIGWRALGRSSLSGKSVYRSTGNWMIYAIILIVVLAIIGSVIIIALAISSFISNPFTPPAANSTSIGPILSQNPELDHIFLGFFGLIAVLIAIWDGTWIKMCLSMRKLGRELSEPRLKTAGTLYIIYVIFGIATGLSAVLILYYGHFTAPSLSPTGISPFTAFSGIFGYFALGGYFALLAAAAILGNVILAVGSYLGYSTTSSAIWKLNPPPPYPYSTAGTQFCPNCGHSVGQVDIFCPNCSTKLR